MPRNPSTGVHSLPPGSIVTNGELAVASQRDARLLDIAAELNALVRQGTARDGIAGGHRAGDAAGLGV